MRSSSICLTCSSRALSSSTCAIHKMREGNRAILNEMESPHLSNCEFSVCHGLSGPSCLAAPLTEVNVDLI